MTGEKETWIGSYRLIKELGRGGMGVVYLAYDKNVNREVAIKVIVEKSQETLARFGREAKSIASLEHPNIIKLYDFFYMNDIPFMVMEYVVGDELEDYIVKHKLSIIDSIKLLIPIVNAVFYAHSKGVIHRDIKPSNILVDDKGKPFLMDFGLAKVNEVTDKSLTKTGVAMGSPGYMSPEQAQGKKKLSFSTDIYSLGATLYKVITGVPPVEGNTIMEFLYRLAYEKIVPPRQKKSSIPKDLEVICLKALEKKKEDRYQNAKLFAVDLMSFVTGKKIKAKKKWSRTSFLVIASVFFISLGVYKYSYDKSVAIQEKKDTKVKLKEMEENPEMIVHHWIRNGFYEKAEDSLEEALKEKKIVLKKYNFYMAMIKGREGKNEEFERYRDLVGSKSEDEIRELEITKYYLDGISFYKREQFKKALENFATLERMGEFLSNSDKLFYYMGRCFLEEKDYLKGKEYIEKAKLGDWGEIYNSVGDAYFGLRDYEEAEKNYRKCLETKGDNSNVYVKLSRSLLKQGKILEAGKILEEISRLDIANLEISKSFIQLAMQDSSLLEKHYFGVLHSLDEIEYKEECVLDFYLRKVIEENEQYYILRNTLQKQQEVDLDKLLERLNDNNVYTTAKSGLLSARYQKRFEKIKIDSLNEHQEKIYKDILHIKKEETKKINYYIMAKSLLYPKLGILEEISVADLFSILEDDTREILCRYLAAGALIRKYKWHKLIEITKNKDWKLKIISIAALEDADIYLDYKNYNDMGIIKDKINEYVKDEFLQLLVLRHYQVLDLEKELSYLLKNATLSSLLGIRKENLLSIGLSVGATYLDDLERFFSDSEKTFLHDLAKSRYWGILPDSRKEKWEKFWDMFDQHNIVVKKTILERGINDKSFKISDEIIKDIVLNQKESYLKIMAVKNIALRKDLELLIELFDKCEDELLKVYIFFRAVIIKFLISGRILDNKLLDENSSFLRSYGYAFYTIFGGEVLKLLEKEKNDLYLQANIMRFSTLPNPVSFLTQGKRSTNKERKQILEKYLNMENLLQRESWISYVYFSEYLDIVALSENSIYKKNPVICESIAEGIRHQLRDFVELGENKSLNFTMFKDAGYFIEQYMGMGEINSLNMFRDHIKEDTKRKKYRDRVERILLLNNEDPLGLVWLGLLEKQDKNYDKALQALEKANQLQEKLLYNVELADVYWQKEGSVPQSVLDKIMKLVKNKDVIPLTLRPLAKMGTIDFMEEIFMANRLCFIQLRSSKRKDEEMLKESGNNLVLYYKGRGKGGEEIFYKGK